MVEMKFERTQVCEVSGLLRKHVPDAGKSTTCSHNNLQDCPVQGDVIDLLQIPVMKETYTKNESDNAVQNNKPVVENILADGTSNGVAPLQNHVNPIESYDVVVDALSASTVANENTNTSISQLKNVNE